MSGNNQEISSSELDGVRVILTGISFEERSRNWTAVRPQAVVENGSANGITEVTYCIFILDEDGNEIGKTTECYAGIDRVLLPGESTDAGVHGCQLQFARKPAGAEVKILGSKSEAELPPVRLPHPGEFLYQALGDEKIANIPEDPPVSITCHTDRGGVGHDASYTEENGLKEAMRAFCAIRIRGKTDVWVTDNYNWISLEWKDGTKKMIRLNMYNLELHVHNREFIYQLDGIQNLFMMSASMDRLNEELSRFRHFRSF